MRSFAFATVILALVQSSFSMPAMKKRDPTPGGDLLTGLVAEVEGIVPGGLLSNIIKRAEQDLETAHNSQTGKSLLAGLLPDGLLAGLLKRDDENLHDSVNETPKSSLLSGLLAGLVKRDEEDLNASPNQMQKSSLLSGLLPSGLLQGLIKRAENPITKDGLAPRSRLTFTPTA